jgi:predicted ribosomally synthesized peptide with SipW-like signal peptide
MGWFGTLILLVPWLFVTCGLVLLAVGASWAQFTDSENANVVALAIGVLLFLGGIALCCLEEAHRAEIHDGFDGDDEDEEPPKLQAPPPKAPAPNAPPPLVMPSAVTGSQIRWFRV